MDYHSQGTDARTIASRAVHNEREAKRVLPRFLETILVVCGMVLVFGVFSPVFGGDFVPMWWLLGAIAFVFFVFLISNKNHRRTATLAKEIELGLRPDLVARHTDKDGAAKRNAH
jgi:hypothetical protein